MESMQLNPTVCVFDSGIGGLNLLNQCALRLPDVNFAYFADNYNVPYGNRPADELIRLADKAFTQIALMKPLAAVVACNTVTAQCIDFLREKYTFPVLGIQPAVKVAVKAGGKCLVLATDTTVNSKSFIKLINSFSGADICAVACPDLAEFIERNILSLPEQLPEGLLPDYDADSVVLGCTHYSFVGKSIARKYKCPVYDGTCGTANHLYDVLQNLDYRGVKNQKIDFFGGYFLKNKTIFEKMRQGFYDWL